MGPKGIPYIVTHDGRTIRFPDPRIKKNDTIRLNLKSGETMNTYKFAIGASGMVTKGNNIGRCGNIIKVEKHEGSYEIIHVRDENNNEFSTRLANVFVTGNDKHEVQLLKRHNKLTILQEREIRAKRRPVLETAEEEDDA